MARRGRLTGVARSGRAVDVAVAAAVYLYNLPIQGFGPVDGPRALLEYLVPIALCVSHVSRRRAPLLSASVILVTAFLQLGLGMGLLVADVMVVFAVYTVALVRSWPETVAVLCAALGWAVLATVPAMDDYGFSVGDIGLFLVVLAGAAVLGLLRRTRLAYVETLRLRAIALEQESRTRAEMAALQERTRIAREMHDVVSHGLSAIVLLSDGAVRSARDVDEASLTAMRQVRDVSREAMGDMRSMLEILRDPDAQSSTVRPAHIVDDLESLYERSRAVGIPVTASHAGDPTHLDAAIAATVYRVVQESLTNVRKHAGDTVSEVRVDLTVGEETVDLIVRDDGGPRSDPPQPGGHGLTGMTERVAALSGTLQIEASQRGFAVYASIPMQAGPA